MFYADVRDEDKGSQTQDSEGKIDFQTRAPANQKVLRSKWEFADAAVTRILFSLQGAAEERIKNPF
jgi:hypothetical protein